ncbi:MAG: MerR family transcriptional regulator [Acidobacteria bacterium]|nr:MerR family transcriptional regulator [Acidobacteriota bacterium]
MERLPKKLYYKIGEVCDLCEVEPHVLRYWETEFSQLSPSKNSSGQRVYRYRDVRLVRRIKQLLYEEGYTIVGANKKLTVENLDFEQEPPSRPEIASHQDFPNGFDTRDTTAGALPLFEETAESTRKPGLSHKSEKLLEEIRSELQTILEILK